MTVRELTQSYRPLRNKSEQAETMLNQAAAAGVGEWIPTKTGKRGRPSRIFRLRNPAPAVYENSANLERERISLTVDNVDNPKRNTNPAILSNENDEVCEWTA